MPAITAEGLTKIYKTKKSEVHALDGLDLEVEEGTVLGLLGPNGAGKTTTVRILATLLKPDSGRATVLGHDVVRDAQALRHEIGLSGQYAAVDENLTGRENLWMFGRLYQMPSSTARRPGDRAARAVRAGRGRRPGGQDVLRRHASPARPRLRPDRAAEAAVPRRADDRASTRVAGWGCGMSSAPWSGTARRCCSRRNTSRRPTRSPTSIAVVDHGKIIARGTADELKIAGRRRAGRGRRPRPGAAATDAQ